MKVLYLSLTHQELSPDPANLYLAIENDLVIIPVINKIDLPNADRERLLEPKMLSDLPGMSSYLFSENRGRCKGVEAIVDRILLPAK